MLFAGPHDVERWAVRIRHGDVDLAHFRFHPPQESAEEGSEAHGEPSSQVSSTLRSSNERFVVLGIKDSSGLRPMMLGSEPKEGDVASVVLYVPEREAAFRHLIEGGWQEQVVENPSQDSSEGRPETPSLGRA